jgi:hypothetical protein
MYACTPLKLSPSLTDFILHSFRKCLLEILRASDEDSFYQRLVADGSFRKLEQSTLQCVMGDGEAFSVRNGAQCVNSFARRNLWSHD